MKSNNVVAKYLSTMVNMVTTMIKELSVIRSIRYELYIINEL